MDMVVSISRESMDSATRLNIRKAVQFQPYCKNCLLTPTDNERHEYRSFTACEECHLAYFCSTSCQSVAMSKHRRAECADFQDYGFFEILCLHHEKETGESRLVLPVIHPHSQHRPLKTMRSWKQYFDDLSGLPYGHCIDDEFQPFGNSHENRHACRVAKAATNASTFSLTMVAGLESEIADIRTRSRLIVHVVGAAITELQVLKMNEDLLHLLPNLKRLVVGYIGPAFPSKGEGYDSLMDFECCPSCTSANRMRQGFFQRELYHNFKQSSLFAGNPPDLIVAFNSGHADEETDTWRPTLEFILDIGVPAVFTTYNKSEASEEEEVLDSMRARFSKRMSENPWRGFVPYFDTLQEVYEPYYQNYYWYIIKGKVGKAGKA